MGSNPINLAVRFLLEIVALVSMGAWSWQNNQGFLRFVLAIGIPIIAMTIWGIFAVPDDPSRSGKTVVVTPGVLRLIIELMFFIFAVWCVFSLELNVLGWLFGAVVVLHYLISYDRVIWLLKH